MEKQFILFDPVTAERKIVTLKLLAGIAGRTLSGLRYSLKHRSKIRSLNCYILDLDTPISVFRELLAKEVIPDEVWRDIPNSLWQVSSYGRYRSRLRCQDRIVYRLPYLEEKSTSAMLGIRVDDKRQMLRAHEKVVELFIGEIPEGHVVYHKDGNKGNNRVENLGFIKRRELMLKQATATQMKAVIQIDEITGEILAEYKSLLEASRINYTCPKQIKDSIEKNRPAIGFIWKLEEQVADEILYAD